MKLSDKVTGDNMETIIFILFAFLVIVYVYSFMKIRKKKKMGNKSEISEFHNKYHRKSNVANSKNDNNITYHKYITKYNSSVDYISKDDLNNSDNKIKLFH